MTKNRDLALALPATLAFLAFPAVAHAAHGPDSPDIVVEGRVREDLKRVCKQTTATGSIIPLRTCKTKSEWEEIRQRSIALLNQWERDRVQDRFTRTSIENCPTGMAGCE